MLDNVNVRVREGMAIEDAKGESIGKVSEVIYPVAGPSTAADSPDAVTAYLKVDRGLFSLGGHWYIPSSAIREIVEDRIILQVDESKLGDMGWDQRPGWVDE